MNKFLKTSLTGLLSLSLMTSVSALDVSLDGKIIYEDVAVYNDTAYVPIRSMSETLGENVSVTWENESARVVSDNLWIFAKPSEPYLEANGRMLYASEDIKLVDGRTLVPVRQIAAAFDAEVYYDAVTNTAVMTSGTGAIEDASHYYDSDELLWLSRIVEAESGGESLLGKIAVANVVLNRVASSEYPNTIYGVIFDRQYGVQFEPISNGSIYCTASAQSEMAAKLALDGASVVGDSLYFLNPDKATSFWIVQNCSLITSIGDHDFYA